MVADEDLVELLPGKTVLITGWGQPFLSKEILEHASELRLIAHTAGTVASFCGPEVYERGIRVVSGNDVFAESVAEGTLAYMLAALRRIPFYDSKMKQGGWMDSFDNEGLFNKKIGLLGFGTIPHYLVDMLKPFRCRISAYDPYVDAKEMQKLGVSKSEFDPIFTDNDIISLHLPLKPDTEGMVDEPHLRMMKPGAVFVNTSRGAVVDEAALARVLQDGKIHAVLDVYTEEPLAADSSLRSTPNTILLPHMAGPTFDRRVDAAGIVVDDIERFLTGEDLQHEISSAKAANMTRQL